MKTIQTDTISQDPQPDQLADIHTCKQALRGLFKSRLNVKERIVLDYRFGLTDNVCRTLSEIGSVLNVSSNRCRFIEDSALRKLRHPISMNILRKIVCFDGRGEPISLQM